MHIQLTQTVQDLFLNPFNDQKIVLIDGLGYIFPMLKPAFGTTPPSIYISSLATQKTGSDADDIVTNFRKLLAAANIGVHTVTVPDDFLPDSESTFVDSNNVPIMSITTQVRPERKGYDANNAFAPVIIPQASKKKMQFSQELQEKVREQVKSGLRYTYPETDGEQDEVVLPVSVRFVVV